jgi:hypothetical protein
MPKRHATNRQRLVTGANEQTHGRVALVEGRRLEVLLEQLDDDGSDCTSPRMSDESGTSGTMSVYSGRCDTERYHRGLERRTASHAFIYISERSSPVGRIATV